MSCAQYQDPLAQDIRWPSGPSVNSLNSRECRHRAQNRLLLGTYPYLSLSLVIFAWYLTLSLRLLAAAAGRRAAERDEMTASRACECDWTGASPAVLHRAGARQLVDSNIDRRSWIADTKS